MGPLRRRDLNLPLRPLIDPCPQHAYLFRRQHLPLGGHADFFMRPGNVLPHRAVSAIARHDRSADRSALERYGFHVQAIIALLLLRAVTDVTVLLEDRLHVPREIDLSIRRWGQL